MLFDLVETFIDYLRNQKGYSKHTVRSYLTDLRQFSDFIGTRQGFKKGQNAELEPDEITPLIIREYLGSLYGNLSRSTIARKLSAVRSFFLFLEKRGLCAGNPAVDIGTPKQEKHLPGYLSVDHVFRLLEV